MAFILLFEIREFGCSTVGCKYPNLTKYFCKTINTLLQSNTTKFSTSLNYILLGPDMTQPCREVTICKTAED